MEGTVPTILGNDLPPFHKYCLKKVGLSSTGDIPIIKGANPEVWKSFWTSMKPLMAEINFRERIARWALSALRWICLGAYLYLWITNAENKWLFVVFPLVCIPIFWISFIALGYVKWIHFEKINAVVEQHKPSFAPAFAMECRWMASREGPYFLYFIPMTRSNQPTATATTATNPSKESELEYRNGYVRMEIANERLTFGRSNVSAPLYADYLPVHLESISLSDWTDFWSKMDENSNKFLGMLRKHTCCTLVMLGSVIAWYSPVVAGSWLYFLFWVTFLLSVVGSLYFQRQVNAIVADLDALVREYQAKFRPQGVFVEFGWVVSFQWWAGGVARQYLYFYPTAKATTSTSTPV